MLVHLVDLIAKGYVVGIVIVIVGALLSGFESATSFFTYVFLFALIIVMMWRFPYMLRKPMRKTSAKRKALCDWLDSLCPNLSEMSAESFSMFLEGKNVDFVLPYAEILYQGDKKNWFKEEGENRLALDKEKEDVLRSWLDAHGIRPWGKYHGLKVDKGRLFPIYPLSYPDQLWMKVEAFKTKVETGREIKIKSWIPEFQAYMSICLVLITGLGLSILTGYLSLGTPTSLFQTHRKLARFLYSETMYFIFIFSAVYSLVGFIFAGFFVPHWMQSTTAKRERTIEKWKKYWRNFIG